MWVHCFNQRGQHARLKRTWPVAGPSVGGFQGPGEPAPFQYLSSRVAFPSAPHQEGGRRRQLLAWADSGSPG